MAHLYEINTEIARMQERIEWEPDVDAYVDLDTGEILTGEELDALFAELNMNKQEILEWMAKCVINDQAEAAAIKVEEGRLKERRQRFEKRAEKFLDIIGRETGWTNTDLGVATFKVSKGAPLEFSVPEERLVKWLEEHGYSKCVKVKKEVKKTETKALLKKGVDIPGCGIGETRNGNLK